MVLRIMLKLIFLSVFVSGLFAAEFPQFMGAERNNIVNDTKLLKEWPAKGPKELWRIKIAGGFGAPVVFDGKLYLLDYSAERQEDVVRCLDAQNGEEKWRFSYPSKFKKTQYDYSRTMPAVNDRYIVTFGTTCLVNCAERTSDKLLWQKDLVKDYGSTVPTWAAGQNPLIDGNKAIISICGDSVLIAAFDLATGKPIWETNVTENYGMTHNSLGVMTVDGEKIYIGCSKIGAFGVSAKDGRLLFTYKGWTVKTANIPVPLPLGNNRVFFTGGYQTGSLIASLKKKGDEIIVTEEVRLPESEFGSHVHTPILYKDHIYGISTGLLKCLDLKGKVIWDSGKQKFGLGAYIIADDRLYVMNGDKGELFMLEPSPEGFIECGKAKIFLGKQIWAPLVVSKGKMYLRNMTELVCLDLEKN